MHAALSLLAGLLPGLAIALAQQIPLQVPSSTAVPQQQQLVRVSWSQPPNASLWRSIDAQYDVWTATPSHVDLRVSSTSAGRLHLDQLIGELGNITTLHHDVSQLLVKAEEEAQASRNNDDAHSVYHNLEAINSLLRLFAADHGKFARLVEIGKSSQGAPIMGISITRPDSKKLRRKRKKANRKAKAGFLVVGGQHAREWITPAATLYMAHSILLQAAEPKPPKRLMHLLDAFEFTFVPTLNPDGYEYSWTDDRLWRKSRQNVSDDCVGIDLNRNWGYHWSADAESDPCSDSHPGSKPFEAVEVAALRHFMRKSKPTIRAVLDLHSFGLMLMHPYAFSCEKQPSHAEDLIEAAYGGAGAAKAQHGLTWEVGSVCEVSYSSTGQLVDWAYGSEGIKWAYSANLRDSGIHGFLLPASQIRPAGEETLAMLLSVANFIRTKEHR